jgi:hypothetical protein
MIRMSRTTRSILALGALLAASSACSDTPEKQNGSGDSGVAPSVRDSAGGESGVRARDVPSSTANHQGRIPVLEYHLIGDKESRYGRERENFRKDLQLLYDRGYRPITVAQMLDKDFSMVPEGKSPVVFTFDDASPGQFRYIEKGGALEIDPTSGVGIWQDFAKTHPEWKGKATFCLLNGADSGHNFFGDNVKYEGQKAAWRFPKVKWLADNGFELCAHTLWHGELSTFSDAVAQEMIARNLMGIDSAVAGYKVRTLALPKGAWPKNRPLAWQGTWTDPKTKKVHAYKLDAVLEVAGGPMRSPYDAKFNPHSVTRVQVWADELRKTLDALEKTRFVK